MRHVIWLVQTVDALKESVPRTLLRFFRSSHRCVESPQQSSVTGPHVSLLFAGVEGGYALNICLC